GGALRGPRAGPVDRRLHSRVLVWTPTPRAGGGGMTSAVPSHTSFATPASARLPHVGVIIATYNRAALLDDCLRHLAKQDFAPGDEVIVVDNGSTDGTGDIVRRRQPTFPVP